MQASVTSPQRLPWQVALALSLLAADFALGLVQLFTGALTGLTLLVVLLLAALLYALWLWGLYRRINWLRWLTVAGATVGILSLSWTWGLIRHQGNVPLYVLKYVLFDAGAILLCMPQAHAWYTRSPA
jgi:hypothetical protein